MATTDFTAPPRTSFATDPNTRAGDGFYAASRHRECPACYEGLVFLGHLVEQDGEEVEVIVTVPCRRCADSR
jgi:hypothetical protein